MSENSICLNLRYFARKSPLNVGLTFYEQPGEDVCFQCDRVFGYYGELEQIQFLLGHVSVQTTERYLGCKQRLRNAVNDRIGLEPANS